MRLLKISCTTLSLIAALSCAQEKRLSGTEKPTNQDTSKQEIGPGQGQQEDAGKQATQSAGQQAGAGQEQQSQQSQLTEQKLGGIDAIVANLDLGDKDKKAIKKCLEKWKNADGKGFPDVLVDDPKTANGKPINFRKITSINIGTFGFNGIKDSEQTSFPKLIYIPLSLNIGTNAISDAFNDAFGNILGSSSSSGGDDYITHEFLNKNGWYCGKLQIDIGADKKAKTKIKAACGAKVLESEFSLPIGSTGTSSAKTGVHVNSEIVVETVPSPCQ